MKACPSCKDTVRQCMEDRSFAFAHLYKDEKAMDMHIHDCYEIYYSICGGKQFLIDNCFYDIQEGDIFLINQFESHYLSQIDSQKHERIVMSINPEYLKELSTNATDLMLGGRKTVICEFLGTGMISVMPVPLLSVHPREYSQQGRIRYVPSVCVYRWTCPVPPHKPPLQAL